MTQEIKDKLKRTAEQDGSVTEYSFIKGAQTILDNPEEWGLVEKRLVDAGIQLRIETVKTCEETHLQNEKYREALERILQGNCSPIIIAKEALKQQ